MMKILDQPRQLTDTFIQSRPVTLFGSILKLVTIGDQFPVRLINDQAARYSPGESVLKLDQFFLTLFFRSKTDILQLTELLKIFQQLRF